MKGREAPLDAARSSTDPSRIIQKRVEDCLSTAPESLPPAEVLDCYGLLCPVPIRKTAQALEGLSLGRILQVIATDEWFLPDLEAWMAHQSHQLVAVETKGTEFHAYIRKQ